MDAAIRANYAAARDLLDAAGYKGTPMMVGVERFELSTSCSQSRRSTKLSYTPMLQGRQ